MATTQVDQLIVSIEARLDKLEAGLVQADKKASSFIGGISKGFAAVTAIIAGIVVVVNKLTKEFEKAEKTSELLSNSLRRTGQIDAFGALTQQAETLMKSTLFDDEQTKNAQRRLIDLGISANDAIRLIPAAMDLASSRGISLEQSADILARSARGLGINFRQAGFTMDEVNAKGGGLEGTLKMVEERFGGTAKAAGQTFSGQLQILKNQLGEVAENLGGALMPLVIKVFETLLPIVEQFAAMLMPFLDQVVPQLMSLLDAIMPPIMNLINSILPMLLPLIDILMPLLSEIVKDLLPPLVELLQAILIPILQALDPILRTLVEILKPIIWVIGELIKGIQWLVDFIAGAVLKAFDDFKERIASIKEFFGKLSDAFVNSEFYKKAKNFFTDLKDSASKFWDNVKRGFASFEEKIPVLKSIHQFFDGVIAKIKEIWDWFVKILGITAERGKQSRTPAPIDSKEPFGPARPIGLGGLGGGVSAGESGGGGGGESRLIPSGPYAGFTVEQALELQKMDEEAIRSLRVSQEGGEPGQGAIRAFQDWIPTEEEIKSRIQPVTDALQEIRAKAEETFNAVGAFTEKIFSDHIDTLFSDMSKKLKLTLDKNEGFFVSFLKNVWNSIVELAVQVITSSLIQIAVNLVRMLAGDVGAFAGGGIGGIILGAIKGVLGFDYAPNDSAVRGWMRDLVSNIGTGASQGLGRGLAAAGAVGGEVYVLSPDLVALAEKVRTSPEDVQRKWGIATRKAINVEERSMRET